MPRDGRICLSAEFCQHTWYTLKCVATADCFLHEYLGCDDLQLAVDLLVTLEYQVATKDISSINLGLFIS
jgi:hypothetical protein